MNILMSRIKYAVGQEIKVANKSGVEFWVRVIDRTYNPSKRKFSYVTLPVKVVENGKEVRIG